MSGIFKQISLWIVILIILLLGVYSFGGNKDDEVVLTSYTFSEQLKLGNVDKVDILRLPEEQYLFKVQFKDEVEGQALMEFETDQFKEEWRTELAAQNIPQDTRTENTAVWSFIWTFVPFILIFGLFWFFMMRQMQGGSNKAMSFGKSRARRFSPGDKMATFKDVAGVDEAKEELQEIIEFLRDPKKFTKLGGKIPKGVLLIGPPGCGKTLLARAVAGEANVPFFAISASDFVDMFVGVGASRVRDLFAQGQKNAPCIIFIDEIDAVGRQRGAGLGGGHDEREQTLNQLLVEMDGFSTNEGVILMAATNRPDVLDKALMRPGRFDRQVMVGNPDIKGRESILGIHIENNNVPIAEDVETRVIARGTPGFSGADLANLVNEAALLAARRDQEVVMKHDFEEAKDRVMMGPERRSLVISAKEARNTAVHEAGHALVCRLMEEADPVHKVTIVPRGPSLGLTSWLPEEDRHNIAKKYALAMLRVAMGGRAAEEIVYDEFTSGAAGDLQMATGQAHSMVCEWGMSALGPIAFGSNREVFLGRDFSKERDYSEATASAVDKTISAMLEDAYADAKAMLTEHRAVLDAITEALVERETLDGKQLDEIITRVGGPDILPEREEYKEPVQVAAKEEVVETETDSTATPSGPELNDDAPPPGDIVPGTA
ncbi:MAG: ATP-dependent zinc metalloprotease FtsH [Candidatus Hydrogenedentota bacterium]